MKGKYIHDEDVHNYKAANEIVPVIIKWLKPYSVIDVGCGIGTWLSVFKDEGVSRVYGVDGDYVDRKQLVISETDFLPKDLEQPLELKNRYDLVVSLEVAEHLSENSAQSFINSLCNLGNTILFSAAITAQGGQNHINEQAPNFWIKKFEDNGYKLFDVLRPKFWDNQNVDWWYKQNIMIFTKDIKVGEILKDLKTFEGRHLVHPILFENRSYESRKLTSKILKIENGNKQMSYYFKLFIKSFKNIFS